MTVFARDADNGQARWVYQMTPHDEWDYDGVNEMILADQQIGGQNRKILVHFDRNGLAYTLDRTNGELLVAEKYDPTVNWTTGVVMNKSSPTVWPAAVVRQYSTDQQGEDVNTKSVCPAALGTKNQQPAAFSPIPACSMCRRTTSAWTMSRSACATRRASPMSGRRSPCTRRRASKTWATSSPGMPAPARSSGRCPSNSRCGPARSRPQATSCSTARSKAT